MKKRIIAAIAGAIFGVTGGVTEAVLRRLKNNSSSEVLDAISFTGIRGVVNGLNTYLFKDYFPTRSAPGQSVNMPPA